MRDARPPRFQHLTRALVLAAALAAGAHAAAGRPGDGQPPAPGGSRSDVLVTLWDAYRDRYVAADGRVVDRTRADGDVTSEGQSYALLQAAWLGDRPTFDRVLGWTTRHLARPDGLHAWLWTSAGGGRVLDANSATDAEIDIAFALVVGAQAFGDGGYAHRARRLAAAVRTHARLDGPRGWWMPSAGNWAGPDRIVNPSYLAPYAFAHFARLDPEGRWPAAIDATYGLLEQAMRGDRLPPDFARVDPEGRLMALPAGSRLSADFSYDAIRVPWRLALACRLTGRREACQLARRLGHALLRLHDRDGRLVGRYTVDGRPLAAEEPLSVRGAVLPAVALADPGRAVRLGADWLSPAVLATLAARDDRYYDANWVWFGLAAEGEWLEARTPRVRR